MGWVLFAALAGWIAGGTMAMAACKSEIVNSGRLTMGARVWKCTEVKEFNA